MFPPLLPPTKALLLWRVVMETGKKGEITSNSTGLGGGWGNTAVLMRLGVAGAGWPDSNFPQDVAFTAIPLGWDTRRRICVFYASYAGGGRRGGAVWLGRVWNGAVMGLG